MSDAKRPTLEERAKAWMREHWFDDEDHGPLDALVAFGRAAYLDGKRDGVEEGEANIKRRLATAREAIALLDGGDDGENG